MNFSSLIFISQGRSSSHLIEIEYYLIKCILLFDKRLKIHRSGIRTICATLNLLDLGVLNFQKACKGVFPKSDCVNHYCVRNPDSQTVACGVPY